MYACLCSASHVLNVHLRGGALGTYSDVMCEMLLKRIALGTQIACWVLYELGTAAEECLAAVLAHTVPVSLEGGEGGG